MPDLTPEQRQAVEFNHPRILVSASAGTGKTHVLTQRYLRLVLKDGVEVRQILAVTFTDAAAAEMRSRIAQELRSYVSSSLSPAQGDWLRRQLLLLERAPISTLHSFCLRVLREFFYLLDLDPDFSVLDPAQAEVLKRDALEDTLEQWFERRPPEVQDKNFYSLVDHYGGLLAGERLPRMLLELHAFLETIPDPDEWWKSVRRLYTSPDPAADSASSVRAFWQWVSEESPAAAIAELRSLAPLVDVLHQLYSEFAENYNRSKSSRAQLDFADLERLTQRLFKEHPRVLEQLRKRYRYILVDEYQDINPLQNALLEALAECSPSADRGLFMVGDDKQSIYGFRLACPALFQEKVVRYRRITPDSDQPVEGLAADARALPQAGNDVPTDPGVCVPLTKNFRSRRTIVEAVNAIFGRIAQSEGFGMRYDDAAALVFAAAHYDAAADLAEEEPVTLYVLPNVEPEQADDSEGTNGDGEKLDISQRLANEARLAAQLIRQWVGNRRVWDNDQKTFRPAEYRDVALLLRNVQGRAQILVRELRQLGIPIHAELRRGFWEALEVRDLLALLQLLRNPLDDVPLAAVLRSPLVGLSVEDLARIRLAQREGPFYLALHQFIGNPSPSATAPPHLSPDDRAGSLAERIREFLERLKTWRLRARRQPIARLIWDIYRETGYLAFVQALPDGAARAANLILLHDFARQFEKSIGGDLERFLHYLERLQENDQDFGLASTLSPTENTVRLMSIHESKGLEFPIVLVMDLGGQFNEESLRRPLLFHRDGLLGMRMRDEERGVWHWPSRLYCWLRETLRTDFLAEELRLLYVAMTRARECLALIGTHNSSTKPSNAKDAGAGETIPPPEKVHCPLQWLLPVFRWAQSEKVSVLRLQEWPASGERKPPNVAATHFASASGYEPTSSDKLAATPSRSGEVPTQPESGSESPWGSANTTDRPSWQQWLADLDWQYPYQIVTRWPGKASPTRLRLWLENDEETYPLRVNLLGDSQGLSANAIEGRFSGESWRFRRQAAARPGFLATAPAGPNAAERGRLVHRLLRHLDLQQSVDQEDELRRQLAALVGEKVFTQEEAEVIDVSLLADFFRRPLGDRLRRAQHVQRELPFSLLLPATELAAWLTRHSPGLAPNALDPLAREQVLVQGVMDLLFWEEMRQGPILVDFKTDELSAEELPEAQRRYVPQLALYARAVAEALGQTCREVWLVFLRLRQDILLQQEMLASCLPHSPPSS